MTLEAVLARFKDPGKISARIAEALAALEDLGMVNKKGDQYRLSG